MTCVTVPICRSAFFVGNMLKNILLLALLGTVTLTKASSIGGKLWRRWYSTFTVTLSLTLFYFIFLSNDWHFGQVSPKCKVESLPTQYILNHSPFSLSQFPLLFRFLFRDQDATWYSYYTRWSNWQMKLPRFSHPFTSVKWSPAKYLLATHVLANPCPSIFS